MNWVFIILLILLVGAVVASLVVIPQVINNDDNNKDVRKAKGLFGACRNNFDCTWGFVCEQRDHPSQGMCVIAPGGACYGNKSSACYSGYSCDSTDGVCVKD